MKSTTKTNATTRGHTAVRLVVGTAWLISWSLAGCAAPEAARESAEQLALVSHAAQAQLNHFEDAQAASAAERRTRLAERERQLTALEGEVAMRKQAWGLSGDRFAHRTAMVHAIRDADARRAAETVALSHSRSYRSETRAQSLAAIAQAFAAVSADRTLVEDRDFLVAFYAKLRASIARAKAQAEHLRLSAQKGE